MDAASWSPAERYFLSLTGLPSLLATDRYHYGLLGDSMYSLFHTKPRLLVDVNVISTSHDA